MVVATAALGNKTSTVLFHFFEPFQHFLAFIISLTYRRRNVVRRGRGQAKVTLAPVFSAVMIAKLPRPREERAGCGQRGKGRRGRQGPRGSASPAGGQGALPGSRLPRRLLLCSLPTSFRWPDTGLIRVPNAFLIIKAPDSPSLTSD